MIKKHENNEKRNPMEFFIQEVLIAKQMLEEKKIEMNEVKGYKRIELLKSFISKINQKYRYRLDNSYVFVGSLLIQGDDLTIVSISNNNTGIRLSNEDFVLPLYLKLETLFDEEIATLTIERMINDTISLFSELGDKIIEHYFHTFSLFDFDLNFINVLFNKINTNYLIDYFVKDSCQLRSEKVIMLDSKRDFPTSGIAYNLTNKQSKKLINSITSYLYRQVDIKDLLSKIIQKIKNNTNTSNRSFFIETGIGDNFEDSIQKRTITLFKKLSFDEQVLFISSLEQEFYSFEDPQVLSFLLSDLFCVLQNNKRFKKRKEALLTDDAFINSLVTCSAFILISKKDDIIHTFTFEGIEKQLFHFLFIGNKEKVQFLLFDKLKSMLSKGFTYLRLDNFLLLQLLLSDKIVIGFEDNFINFLKSNLNFISICDNEIYIENPIQTENDWLFGTGSIRKGTEIILNKIRTDSQILSVMEDDSNNYL